MGASNPTELGEIYKEKILVDRAMVDRAFGSCTHIHVGSEAYSSIKNMMDMTRDSSLLR